MKKCILKDKRNLMIGICVLWSLWGCESTYYKTMETMGYHKRDIMVDRVQDARDAQEEAKEQFESALEKFSSVLGFKGGDLEEKYEQLKAEYEEKLSSYATASSQTEKQTEPEAIEFVETEAEPLLEIEEESISPEAGTADESEEPLVEARDGTEKTLSCECCGKESVPENDLVKLDSGQLVCPDCLIAMRGG